jgi:hypothetical protein
MIDNLSHKIVMDLCSRIEQACRYSPLDDQEVEEQSFNDRTIVAGLYIFYRQKGDTEEVAGRRARTSTIRLILNEVFS